MRFTQKLLITVAALCMTASLSAQKNDTTLYFTVDEMPDLIKCLPAPPDTCSAEFTNDILRYMWGKQ